MTAVKIKKQKVQKVSHKKIAIENCSKYLEGTLLDNKINYLEKIKSMQKFL